MKRTLQLNALLGSLLPSTLCEHYQNIDFTRLATLLLMAEQTSLIWITHAQKDGKAYLGESSWAQEADIVVRCDEGQAVTQKNRFGVAGHMISIY